MLYSYYMTNTLTDAPSEDILRKVAALLRKAEDPAATDPEAEAFLVKAQQMMARHSISEAMLADAAGVEEDIIWGEIEIHAPHVPRKQTLACVVGRHTGTRPIIIGGTGRKIGRVRIVGTRADVEWAKTLYNSLEKQLESSMYRARRSNTCRDHGLSFAVAFVAGFTDIVNARLAAANREAKKEAEAEQVSGDTSTVALVLVKKEERVSDEFRRAYPSTLTKKMGRPISSGGYSSGREAGRNASLARGSVGGGNRGIGR